jgi:hypothetical protein
MTLNIGLGELEREKNLKSNYQPNYLQIFSLTPELKNRPSGFCFLVAFSVPLVRFWDGIQKEVTIASVEIFRFYASFTARVHKMYC